MNDYDQVYRLTPSAESAIQPIRISKKGAVTVNLDGDRGEK